MTQCAVVRDSVSSQYCRQNEREPRRRTKRASHYLLVAGSSEMFSWLAASETHIGYMGLHKRERHETPSGTKPRPRQASEEAIHLLFSKCPCSGFKSSYDPHDSIEDVRCRLDSAERRVDWQATATCTSASDPAPSRSRH